MSEKRWDEKMMDFLKATGDDIRVETQRLMNEINDPANQEKVRQKLREIGDWAKKTAEEAAGMVEQASEKVETVISKASAQRAQGKKSSSARRKSPTSKRAGKSAKRKARKKA